MTNKDLGIVVVLASTVIGGCMIASTLLIVHQDRCTALWSALRTEGNGVTVISTVLDDDPGKHHGPAPTPEAISTLRRGIGTPEDALKAFDGTSAGQKFDEVYGPGAAQGVLHKEWAKGVLTAVEKSLGVRAEGCR